MTCSLSLSSRVDSIDTSYEFCGTSSKIHIMGNFSSDSEFFVAIGVLAFLYSIAAIVLYCFFSGLYDNDEKVPLAVGTVCVFVGGEDISNYILLLDTSVTGQLMD